MKKIAFAALLISTGVLFIAMNKRSHSKNSYPVATRSSPLINVADTPRMKQYWLVQLLRGDNRNMDKVTAQRIQAAHLANMDRLWSEGKLVMAGPMGYKYDNNWRGIVILDAPDSVTAATYMKTDSAVITGRLRFEIHPWWTQTGSYTFK